MPIDPLAETLARRIISEIAPEEIEVFEQLWCEAESNPEMIQADFREGFLGMDAKLVEQMYSLIVIPFAVTIATSCATMLSSALTEYIREYFKKLRGSTAADNHPPLKDEEVERVVRIVLEESRRARK